MGKYFITGNAGTGKSTIILALQERGFAAYDIDELPEIHGFFDIKTQQVLDELPEIETHGAAGFTRYTSYIKEAGLKKLLQTDQTIFIGGSATMQERYYPLFNKTFGLVVPADILEKRLADRTNNPTGNNDEDRAYLLSINERIESQLRAIGATLIDAKKPLDEVVGQILGHIHES